MLLLVVIAGGNMKFLVFLTLSVFVSTSSAGDLAQALGAALKEAEQNHSDKQVALGVDADKIEKAKFRKNQDPRIVNIRAVADVDQTVFSSPESSDASSSDSEDEAQAISKEINDN